MNEEYNNKKNFIDDLAEYFVYNTAGEGEQILDKRYTWIVFIEADKSILMII